MTNYNHNDTMTTFSDMSPSSTSTWTDIPTRLVMSSSGSGKSLYAEYKEEKAKYVSTNKVEKAEKRDLTISRLGWAERFIKFLKARNLYETFTEIVQENYDNYDTGIVPYCIDRITPKDFISVVGAWERMPGGRKLWSNINIDWIRLVNKLEQATPESMTIVKQKRKNGECNSIW